jgi:N-acetylneuraminate synthase
MRMQLGLIVHSISMTKIIAEIGINHNGSIELCKRLMLVAKAAGCDYAKIQKRNPDVCVPDAQKSKRRMTPWGEMSYIEYKHRMEFSEDQVRELCDYGQVIGIQFFASVWDLDSARLMARHTRIAKLGSASITDLELCRLVRELYDTVIISTGMSTEEEVEAAVTAAKPDVIMHTNSTYPTPVEDLNLRYIEHLQEKFGESVEVGYSGHEYGLVTTFAAVTKGAKWVERHITLDRTMWGSDQSSSIEPSGLMKLVKGIRDIEKATQYSPGPRRQFAGEAAKRESLRK